MSLGGILKRTLHRHSSQGRLRSRVLRHFARKMGLVYFGTVDQHVDEHDIIRGLTVSTSHKDDHYAVGAYDGYDISMVDRSDIVSDANGNSTAHRWLILQIDLEREESLPHIFLRPVNHSVDAYAQLFRGHHQLQPVNGLFLGDHSSEFHARYELLASSTHALNLESLLNPQVTQSIAARLWPYAIELAANKLYIYTTEQKLNETTLSVGLESALWLARVLDQSEQT